MGYSRAVRVGNVVEVAGTTPQNAGEQTVLAYALGANEAYELTGTHTEPGPMHSRRLLELAIAWDDIFEELP